MTPLELVAHVSEGLPVSPTDIDAFIAAHRQEGQHIDYKSGLLATEPHGSAELRRHIAGMANVAGGLLILGVHDDLTIDGINPKGGRGAKGWAENSASPLAAFFTTPPHFCEVAHPSGVVLIIAIHRNGRLIPVIEQGRMRYYLRLGDQTLEAPETHVTDLLLGRRELPIIDLRAEKGEIRDLGDSDGYSLEVDLFNEGSIWIDEVQVGLIGWHVFLEGQPKDKLPNTMRASLNAITPKDLWQNPESVGLHHTTAHRDKIPPLDGQRGIRLGPLRIDGNAIHSGRIFYLKAAVFCIPRDGSIQWFQLSCAIAKVDFGQRVMASPPQLAAVQGGDLVEVAWHIIRSPPPRLIMTQTYDWEAMLGTQRDLGK